MKKKIKTQQEVLNEIIKNNISPTMRELGFKRKGRNFIREDSGYTQKLNVLSSRWNDRHNVDFTIDLFLHNGDQELLNKRIGFLKSDRDYWYTLNPNVSATKVGRQVEDDVKKYVKAFFKIEEDLRKYLVPLLKKNKKAH